MNKRRFLKVFLLSSILLITVFLSVANSGELMEFGGYANFYNTETGQYDYYDYTSSSQYYMDIGRGKVKETVINGVIYEIHIQDEPYSSVMAPSVSEQISAQVSSRQESTQSEAQSSTPSVVTQESTVVATQETTVVPTQEPTVVPTQEPTVVPTQEPTATSTSSPTGTPKVTTTPTPETTQPQDDNSTDSLKFFEYSVYIDGVFSHIYTSNNPFLSDDPVVIDGKNVTFKRKFAAPDGVISSKPEPSKTPTVATATPAPPDGDPQPEIQPVPEAPNPSNDNQPTNTTQNPTTTPTEYSPTQSSKSYSNQDTERWFGGVSDDPGKNLIWNLFGLNWENAGDAHKLSYSEYNKEYAGVLLGTGGELTVANRENTNETTFNAMQAAFNEIKGENRSVIPVKISFDYFLNVSAESKGLDPKTAEEHNLHSIHNAYIGKQAFEIDGYITQNQKGEIILISNSGQEIPLSQVISGDVKYQLPNGKWVTVEMIDSLKKIYSNPPSDLKDFENGLPADQQVPVPNPDPNNPKPSDSGLIKSSKSINPIPYVHMTTDPKGEIKSSSGQYDVTDRIPTSENLTYTATTDDVLYDIMTREHILKAWVSNAPISASITYTHDTYDHWQEEDGTETVTDPVTGKKSTRTKYKDCEGWRTHTLASYSRSDTYSTSKQKIYYDVSKSNIYSALYADVEAVKGSYLLKGTPQLNGPSGPGGQTIETFNDSFSIGTSNNKTIHLGQNASVPGDWSSTLDGLLGDVKGWLDSACDRAIGLKSGSCDYTFTSKNTLHVTTTSHNRTDPGWNTITRSDGPKMIPDYYENGFYKGSCVAYYSGGFSFTGPINNVNIHTPVVAQDVRITTSPFINQKAIIDSNINYVQLDEGFTVVFPNRGTHLNSKGYGTRDYNSFQAVTKKITDWGEIKDVKVPFDVYVYALNGSKTYYLPANNWLSEYEYTKDHLEEIYVYDNNNRSNPVSINFLVPVWAKEGLYNAGENQIQIRIMAENAFDQSRKKIEEKISRKEQGANLNIDNYVAYKNFPVEVIGKIYDFNVLDSSDPGWEGKGGTVIGGGFVPIVSATNLPYGVTKTPVASKVAPISQNKTQTYNYSQKLGYTFVFDFKTKGRNTTNVSIGTAGTVGNEEFYFIGKNTNTVKSVYLYYKDTDGVYKKIKSGMGSEYETRDLEVNLNDSFMKVTPQEKTDTNRIYTLEKVEGAPFNYALKVNIGTLATLNIPQRLRFVYNNMNEYKTDGGKGLYRQPETEIIKHATDAVTKTYGFVGESGKDLVTGSIGHWYVGYALPASTVAVDPDKIPQGSTEKDIDTLIKNDSASIVLKGGYIGVGFNFRPTVPTNLDYNGPEYTKDDGSIPNKDEKATLLLGGQITDNQLRNPTRNWVDSTGSTIPGVPNDVVVLYETDYNATIDNHTVLVK